MLTEYHQAIESAEQFDDTTLFRAVYVSRATLLSRINSAKTISVIEQESHANNLKHELSGVLYYGNGYFLQCLEGEKQDILPILEHIFLDKRHHKIRMIELKPIAIRSFTEWGMRSLLLENWFWREMNQEYMAKLSPFMPFMPHTWEAKRINNFLTVFNENSIPPIHKRTKYKLQREDFSLSYDYLFILILFVICIILIIYFSATYLF